MPVVPLTLKLVAVHLLGDYLFQPSRLAVAKRRPAMLALHALIHGVLLAAVALSEPAEPRLWWALGLLLATHVGIDRMSSRMDAPGLGALAWDQGLHLVALGLAVALARPAEVAAAASAIGRALADPRAWVLLGGAVMAVWTGAVVVGRAVRPLARGLEGERPGLERAGRLIGLFERVLVFLAVLLRTESLVGFVIAAKAVLRLPEAREPRSRGLAEYYLVGTLLSVCWAVVVGLLVRWYVSGRP